MVSKRWTALLNFTHPHPKEDTNNNLKRATIKKRLYQNRNRKHPPNKRFGKIMSLPHCQNRRCLKTKRWLKMHTRWISDRDKYLPKRKYHLYWLFCLSIVAKPDLAPCTFGLYYKNSTIPSTQVNTSTPVLDAHSISIVFFTVFSYRFVTVVVVVLAVGSIMFRISQIKQCMRTKASGIITTAIFWHCFQ